MPWIKDKDGNWVDVPGSGGGSVTKAKVVAALGYTPAKDTDVPAVDRTLKVSGAAADAKVVGEKFTEVSEAIADLETEVGGKQPKGDYALRSEIPSMPDVPVQSVNGKTGAVKLTAEDVGAVTDDYVDGAIADLKAQGLQQTPEYAEGETVEEQLAWLAENGDQSKIYLLTDGFLYQYKLTTVESKPTYTNILPLAVNADGTPYVGENGEKGYKTGYRLNSSKAEKEQAGMCCTGFMPVSGNGILQVKTNGKIVDNNITGSYLYGFKEDRTTGDGAYSTFSDGNITETNGVWTFDMSTLGFRETVRYVRLSIPAFDENTVITYNEEITESGGTTTGYAWTNTGHAFVPADYEERIVEVEERSASNTERIAELEEIVENGLSDVLTDDEKLKKIKEWDKPIYDSAPVTLLSDERNKPALGANDKTVPAIYAKYRALMAAHPKYITETNMGLCTGSDTFTAVDMLRFDFKEPDGMTQPDMSSAGCHETKPKIIIMSGVHAEFAGIYGLYYALEEITTNPDFDDIRRNAHIIVIPCANPAVLTSRPAVDGWQMSHVNVNGVAIHNNFGVNHRSSGSPGEYNYGGATPYSELETQHIDAVMAENSDAIAFLTCHNNDYSTYYGSHVMWASSATYYMCNVSYRLIDKLTKAWYDKYGQALKDAADEYKINMDKDDYRLGRVTMSSSYGTEQKNATKYGIQATNLEIPRMMYVFSGNTDCSSEVMTRGAEVYANFLRTVLAAYSYTDKEAQYK